MQDKTNLIIRTVTEADAPALCAIYAPYVEKTAVSLEYIPPTAEEFAGRIRNTLQKYPYFAAEYNGEIVGYIYAGPFHARAAFAWSAEASIYLKKEVHGKGIGRALYAKLESALKEMGIVNLYVSIADPDVEDEYLTKDSERFHTKMGFVRVADFHHCGYKFGRWYNLIYMEKMLGG